MTIGQFTNSVNGYNERFREEAKRQDQLNHILGTYIAHAVNDPKKYPRKPLLSKEPERKRFTVNEFMKQAKEKYAKE